MTAFLGQRTAVLGERTAFLVLRTVVPRKKTAFLRSRTAVLSLMIAFPSERTRVLSLMTARLRERTAVLGFRNAVLPLTAALPSLMNEAPARSRPRLGRSLSYLLFPPFVLSGKPSKSGHGFRSIFRFSSDPGLGSGARVIAS